MPYFTTDDLPPAVQRALPLHAQEIYLSAFNHAWKEYAHRPDREKVAHQVAWAAVKRLYKKSPWGKWVEK